MMVRFHSWEAALSFALQRRNEGYFAELFETSVPFFWGPNAVGGFRVITSEEATDDGHPPMIGLPAPGPWARLLSLAAALLFWSAIFRVVLFLMTALALHFAADPLGLVYAVWLAAGALIVATLVSMSSERAMRNLGSKLRLLLALPLLIAVAMASF
jgi:hypothetical protein